MKVADTIKGAYVSQCGLYRPWLSRTHPHVQAGHIRGVLFVLNNPSTADDTVDDPTVTRGWAFTEAWGCNYMVFANTNCYRATDPRNRKPMPETWALANAGMLVSQARNALLTVCAWGDRADPRDAATALRTLRQAGKPLHCLGTLTKAGNPRHILYLKGDLKPTVWTP